MSDAGRREALELHAYQDGELPLWRRWRVARRLRRDARARRELASIEALAGLLREQAAVPSEPDLWEGVRARLATAARPAALDAQDASPAREPWLPAWLGAGLAAASSFFRHGERDAIGRCCARGIPPLARLRASP
jgi:anti-sigma factor RsiW